MENKELAMTLNEAMAYLEEERGLDEILVEVRFNEEGFVRDLEKLMREGRP